MSRSNRTGTPKHADKPLEGRPLPPALESKGPLSHICTCPTHLCLIDSIAMNDVLVRIKRAVLAGHYVFSEKARAEMEADRLTSLDVAESILNAVAIYKRLRSRSGSQTRAREYLYVIQSTNLEGLMIYTKGKLVRQCGTTTYYFLISSKRAF